MTGQTLILSCDWLGVSVRLAGKPKPIPHHVWAEYSGTNVWGERRVLYSDDGDKVLTLLSCPKSSVINSAAGLLEIENEWLYHGIPLGKLFDMLLDSVYFEITGLSRLDLAVDFVPEDYQADIIEQLAAGSMYVGGKRNGSGFWSVDCNERLPEFWRARKIPHCQSWGHKTSAIRWKLYYKSKELLDAGGGMYYEKPYIVDQWRKYGFTENNVWRLEVSMHHLNNYNLYGRRVSLDDAFTRRGELFESLYNSRFQVRKAQGHADRTNDERVRFLPLKSMKSELTGADSKRLAEHHGRISLMRHLVRTLEDEHILFDTPTRHDVMEHISRLINRDHLQNYFFAMTGKYFEDYRQEVEYQVVTSTKKGVYSSVGLKNEEKGSYDAERRLEILMGNSRFAVPNNRDFELYDCEGMPIPKDEGGQKKKEAPPRATQQYTFPLVVKLPSSGQQLRLLT